MNWTNLIIILLASSTQALKILIPLPFAFKSCSNFFLAFATSLAESGHHIEFLTPFGTSDTHPNVIVHQLPEEMIIHKHYNYFEIRKNGMDVLLSPDKFVKSTNIFVNDKRVKDLWQRRNEFDVILTDFFFQEMTFYFLIEYEGTFVQMCSAGISADCLQVLGNTAPPAIVPHYILTATFEHLSFWQRLLNFGMVPATFDYLFADTISHVTDVVKQHHPSLGTISEYRSRTELTFFNSHFVTDHSLPLLPNQVQIGCLNCACKGNLTHELQTFMDGAGKDGVIYFSLGSVANPNDIPPTSLSAILDALKQLPQRIIMKLNTQENLPSNIIARKWLPQRNILAHPNLRLFMSHCGLQSVQEAQYHGIPILGLPITLDQPQNAKYVKDAGIAEILQWEDLSTDLIVKNIHKILKDPSYKNRALKISKLLQDEMETPAHRANWWLEYTVRHHKDTKIYYKGKDMSALHYKGKDLNVYQILMIDVMVFLFFTVTIIFCVCFVVIRMVFCRKKNIKKSKTN